MRLAARVAARFHINPLDVLDVDIDGWHVLIAAARSFDDDAERAAAAAAAD